jgi:hypothetical protein
MPEFLNLTFSYQPLHIDKLNFASKQCNGYNYTTNQTQNLLNNDLRTPLKKKTIYNFIAVQK